MLISAFLVSACMTSWGSITTCIGRAEHGRKLASPRDDAHNRYIKVAKSYKRRTYDRYHNTSYWHPMLLGQSMGYSAYASLHYLAEERRAALHDHRKGMKCNTAVYAPRCSSATRNAAQPLAGYSKVSRGLEKKYARDVSRRIP